MPLLLLLLLLKKKKAACRLETSSSQYHVYGYAPPLGMTSHFLEKVSCERGQNLAGTIAVKRRMAPFLGCSDMQNTEHQAEHVHIQVQLLARIDVYIKSCVR